MNSEIKAKWVAALRSGEYRQGEKVLRYEDQFCCLGVLCELHRQDTGDGWDPLSTGDFIYGGKSYLPPDNVIEWAGLDSDAPSVVGDDGYFRGLPDLNDDGLSFTQIADLIEEQL